jgi:hypothetical protein
MSGFNYSKWDNLEDSDDEQPPKPSTTHTSSKPSTASKPSPGGTPEPPSMANINIDDDDRSEVEKLKAKKRAERAAREAAKPAAEKEDEATFMEPVVAEAAVDTNAADAVQSSSNAEKQLAAAEATVKSIQAEIVALNTGPGVPKADNLKQRTLNLQGQVGKLQASLDEIYLGDLDDSARDACKQRRKKMNGLLENDFPGQITALKKLW